MVGYGSSLYTFYSSDSWCSRTFLPITVLQFALITLTREHLLVTAETFTKMCPGDLEIIHTITCQNLTSSTSNNVKKLVKV